MKPVKDMTDEDWPKKKRLIKKILTKRRYDGNWNKKWIGNEWRIKKSDLKITNDLLLKVWKQNQ